MNIKNHICNCKEGCEINIKKSEYVVKSSESKTKYIIENKSGFNVSKYIVDDCLLKKLAKNKKCDYLFVCELKESTKKAIFVELKGSDVLEAIAQLSSSLDSLVYNLKDHLILGRIIPTKISNPESIKGIGYKKLYKRLNGNLKIKNIQLTDTL